MNLEVLDLGRMGYAEAYKLQTDCVRERIMASEPLPDRFMLVEHDPVYTLGRNASLANVMLSEKQREAEGIDLVQTDRGGQVTYHGPGQITGYPIMKLSPRRKHGVAWYVHGLEDVLIRTLNAFGLEGRRDTINPGVWIGHDKIAAIGVRVQRQITMHGFALNVRADLTHYQGIIPCGIQQRGVTSMHVFFPDISISNVREVLIRSFCQVFEYPQPSIRTR